MFAPWRKNHACALSTPLQFEYYLTRALEEAYKVSQKPVGTDMIESILAKDIDVLEPRLTRQGEAQRLANDIGDRIEKTDRDNLIFIRQKLAHALLFQGHYSDALAIYRQNLDKPLNEKNFGETTLEDSVAFDKAGLTRVSNQIVT